MRSGLLLLILITSVPTAGAQVSTGQLKITLQIPKVASLSLAEADSSVQSVGGAAPGDLGQVRLRVMPAGTRSVTISLLARSNTPYRLRVKCHSVEALQEIRRNHSVRVGARSVDSNAGRAHLMLDATNVRMMSGEISSTEDEITVLEGPGISNGGNNATMDNAIRITLEAELPQDVSQADLIVRMEF